MENSIKSSKSMKTIEKSMKTIDSCWKPREIHENDQEIEKKQGKIEFDMENWSEPAWLLPNIGDPRWSALIRAELRWEYARI